MSRCFPYPPPGYMLSRASNVALIESIKLQKEKEKAKEQSREEKRRDKKERKKEKRKDKKEKVNQIKSGAVKTQIDEEIWGKTKGEFNQKGRSGAVAEQLEKSNITEEHGQPLCLHAPSTSSDSTENSHKRKRHSSSHADVSRGHGKIIRIRFSSKKQSDSSVPVNEPHICNASEKTKKLSDLSFPANEEIIPSTSVRTQEKNAHGLKDRRESSSFTLERSSKVDGRFSLKIKTDRDQPICSTSQTVDAFAHNRVSPPPFVPDTRTTLIHKDELQYKKLIEDWVPPPLQDGCIDSDLDWLFKGPNKNKHVEKRCGSVNDGTSSCAASCTSLWPCAQYLPEVNIYALPYTVPYRV